MASINFFFEEDARIGSFKKTPLRKWLKELTDTYNKSIACINYIFCSDSYLHTINIDYLGHNNYTDIITFDISLGDNIIEGDIFISVERVKENACTFEKDFTEEIHRVIVHGLLHLLGYKDKTIHQKRSMRVQEEFWISKNTVPRGTYK